MLKGILENSKRVLIPRLDTHGDIILLQGFLNGLLMKYPHVELTLLVRQGYDQLKSLLSDRIKWMTTKANGYSPPEGKNIEETDVLLNQLEAGEWDTVLTTTYNRTWLNHTVSAKLTGARRVTIGEPEEIEPRIQDLWKQRNILIESPYDEFVPVDEYGHETEKYQVLWEALTGNQEKLSAPVLEVPKEIELRAEEILSTLGIDHREYYICAPAGTDNVQIKAWSEKKYADILCWLKKEHGFDSLVIGSEKEKERLEEVLSLPQEKGCSPSLWIGKEGDLPLAAALIRKAKFYLGNDTGLMHIGSAVGIPVIAIFGGGHWPRFLPTGKSVVLVRELPCFGCNWKCIFGDAPCTKLISVEDVRMAFSLLPQETGGSFRIVKQAEASFESIVEELVRSARLQGNEFKEQLNQQIEYRLRIAEDRETAVQEIHKRDDLIAELYKNRDMAIQEIYKLNVQKTEINKDRETVVQEIHKRDQLIAKLRNDGEAAVREINKRDQLITQLRSDRETAVQKIQKREIQITYLNETRDQTFRMIPLVSIITPVFNAEKWIQDCIKSVMNQDYPKIEHIIVDGGSTDRTLDICRNYPHLVIHSQKDRGQSHAINKGLAMAQGDILAWLCADDEYEPGAVGAAAKEILSGHEVVMGYSRFIDAEGKFIANHPANGHPYYDHAMFLRFWRYNPISQPATFWTRRMWETCGPLRENLYFAMDYDLWLRMSQRARFERLEAPVAKYRIHPDAKCFADNYGSRIELIRVSRRYWPSRWNPGHWVLSLEYLFTWSAITRHYSDAERLLNTALQHLGNKKRLRAVTSFILAHLKHIATPLMPGYFIALQRTLVEGIGPLWFWRLIKRIYEKLRFGKKVTLTLARPYPRNGDTILLRAAWKGYRDPQFRFWGMKDNEFILLRDWGPEKTYGPIPGTDGISDYGVHLRSGDHGDFIDQAWVKNLSDLELSTEGRNQMNTGLRKENRDLTPVCFAYLRELVVLSDGDVTTCCLDAKGMNTLGNINQMPLDQLWQERLLPWHWRNVEANLKKTSWDSSLCNMCLKHNCMSAFNATKTRDSKLLEEFHQRVHPFPGSLVIEPISVCNYACWGCYAGLGELKRKGSLDRVSFNRHILPVIPRLRQVRLYNYGEPFLHPHIIEMIESLRREGPTLNLHISTNGLLMKKEISKVLVDAQVNYLIVSLHGGPTQEGLLKYSRRGPDINVITSNIDYLVNLKKRKGKILPWIFLKAILFNWNDSAEEMEAFLKLGKTLGVDFTGWGINNSDLTFSSKRVAPGTQPYQFLVENKLLESNFYELPAWPPNHR